VDQLQRLTTGVRNRFQTKRGPRGFDVIGISNSIVQEMVNLPTLLAHSGIPLRKADRLRAPDVPLLLLGGANALFTSVLWSAEPLVDAGVRLIHHCDGDVRPVIDVSWRSASAGSRASNTSWGWTPTSCARCTASWARRCCFSPG
jgi:hypothetical protein